MRNISLGAYNKIKAEKSAIKRLEIELNDFKGYSENSAIRDRKHLRRLEERLISLEKHLKVKYEEKHFEEK